MEVDIKAWMTRAVGAVVTGAVGYLVSWGLIDAQAAAEHAANLTIAITAAVAPVVYGIWMKVSDFAMGWFEEAK